MVMLGCYFHKLLISLLKHSIFKMYPLASIILLKVVYLTETRIFSGYNIVADACEKSCFGYGSSDESKFK